MTPSPTRQLWWGAATAIVVIALIAILAFVPDPFHRQTRFTTRFDNVESLGPGAPVFFRGAEVCAMICRVTGSIFSIAPQSGHITSNG